MAKSSTDSQLDSNDDDEQECEATLRALTVVVGVALNDSIAAGFHAQKKYSSLTTVHLTSYGGESLALGNFQHGALDSNTLGGHIIWTVPMKGEVLFGEMNELMWVLGGLTVFSCRYSQIRAVWTQSIVATGDDDKTFCIAYGVEDQLTIVTASFLGNACSWNNFVCCVGQNYRGAENYSDAMESGSHLLYRLCIDAASCARARIRSVSFRITNVQGMIDQLPSNPTLRSTLEVAEKQDTTYNLKCCIADAIDVGRPDNALVYTYDGGGPISYHEWNSANIE